MRKPALVSLSVLLLVAGLSLQLNDFSNNSSATNYKDIETSGLEGYEIERTGDEQVAGIDTQSFYAQNGSRKLEVEIYSDIEKDFAEKIIGDREKELVSIYTDKPAPYGGIPEREIDCNESFGINRTRGEHNNTYSLYADSQYNLGACSREKAEYRVSIKIRYCPDEKTLFESRFFAPVDSEVIQRPEVRCG